MLRKNKIAGISFHHKSNRKTLKNFFKLHDFFNLDDLYVQIKKETPEFFTPLDIKRLLCDQGRNEINGQISQCIDFISKWNGILKMVQRCFPDKYFLNPEYIAPASEENKEIPSFHDEIEIYLLVKRLIGIWKHNLHILEMIGEAQLSLRNYPKSRIKMSSEFKN